MSHLTRCNGQKALTLVLSSAFCLMIGGTGKHLSMRSALRMMKKRSKDEGELKEHA